MGGRHLGRLLRGIVPMLATALLLALSACGNSSRVATSASNTPSPPTTKTAASPNASPSAGTGGTVYVGAADHFVYAIDARTGTQRWRVDTGVADQSTGAPAVSVAGGMVYVGALDHNLYALRASDGTQLWRTLVGWYPSAAVAANGVAYVTSSEPHVYALDTATGAVRWSYRMDDGGGQNVQVMDSVVYAAGFTKLYALSATDGTLLWEFGLGSPTEHLIDGLPTITADSIYLSDSNGSIYALDTATGAVRWHTSLSTIAPSGRPLTLSDGVIYVGIGNAAADTHLYALHAADGTVIWSTKVDGSVGEPVVVGSVIYLPEEAFSAGANENWMYALHVSDGSTIWRVDLGIAGRGTLAGPYWPRPVIVNSMLYIGADDGHLYALRPADGSVVWRIQVSGSAGIPVYAA
jgi:outer membrane protein assembly factor BamB